MNKFILLALVQVVDRHNERLLSFRRYPKVSGHIPKMSRLSIECPNICPEYPGCQRLSTECPKYKMLSNPRSNSYVQAFGTCI